MVSPGLELDLLGASRAEFLFTELDSGCQGWIHAFLGLDSHFWGLLRWSGAQGHPPGVGFGFLGAPGLDSDFQGWVPARFSLLGPSALGSSFLRGHHGWNLASQGLVGWILSSFYRRRAFAGRTVALAFRNLGKSRTVFP